MMSRRKIWYRVDIRETFNLQHFCLFSNQDWSEGCRAVSAADRPGNIVAETLYPWNGGDLDREVHDPQDSHKTNTMNIRCVMFIFCNS